MNPSIAATVSSAAHSAASPNFCAVHSNSGFIRSVALATASRVLSPRFASDDCDCGAQPANKIAQDMHTRSLRIQAIELNQLEPSLNLMPCHRPVIHGGVNRNRSNPYQSVQLQYSSQNSVAKGS